MPRRKRSRPRDGEDEAGPGSRKRRLTESPRETVLISDSEHEEEGSQPSARESRLRGRGSRALTKGLTEEEMLTLAMKLSAEEATTAEQRQKLEEEAMKRAIEESLNVNETQITSDNSESLLPTGRDSPPVPASPVFPAREKPLLQKRRTAGPDGSNCDDALIDVDEEKCRAQPQTPDRCQSTSDDSPKHLPALEEGRYSDAESRNRETRGPSRCQSRRGRDYGDTGEESSCQGPVLCIERLSQELVDDCQASGFVLCSQELPIHLTPSGTSASSPPGSPTPPQSPVFARMDLGSVQKGVPGRGARSTAKRATAADAVQSVDQGGCRDFAQSPGLDQDSSDSSQSLLSCRRTSALRRRGVPKEHASRGRGVRSQASQQGNVSQSQSEAELRKLESGIGCPAEGSVPTTSGASDDLTSHMGRAWSEEEEEEGLGKKSHMSGDADVCSPKRAGDADQAASPVFPREGPRHRLSPPGLDTPRCIMGSPRREEIQEGSHIRRRLTFRNGDVTKSPSQAEDSVVQSPMEERGRPREPPVAGAVHYYWGVPFCPRGQNPDDYTQVILSQLEIYEKSLKVARRTLLRKARWGEPVLPASPERRLRRRGRPKRSRALQPLDDEEDEEAAGQEEGEDTEEATLVEDAEENGDAASPKGSEASEVRGEQGKEPLATQLQKTHVLCAVEEIPEKRKPLRRRGRGESRPAKGGAPYSEGLEDEETQLFPESQLSEEPSAQLKRESSADTEKVHSRASECEVMVLEQEGSVPVGSSVSQEEVEDMETEAERDWRAFGAWVQCPICMQRFPPARIEAHAAYCDDVPEERPAEERPAEEPASQGRRRRGRNVEVTGENQPTSSSNGRPQPREKCFLCQGMFHLTDYDRHVELCIQQKSKREGAKKLLVALEQSEKNVDSVEAGPSDARRESYSSASRREGDGLDYPSEPGFPASTSPIRSFIPISEATDCLVDFKNQYSLVPGQRGGRRKRFK